MSSRFPSLLPVLLLGAAALSAASGPGDRVLLDAHNCYPYEGRWADRIDQALATGLPVAIEQDLFWYRDPQTGKSWSVVTHGEPVSGKEPTLRDYFFERIRPAVEKALRENQRQNWPLIVLNLDFKTNEPEHHAEIWRILGEYEGWLTTAERSGDAAERKPLDLKPVLVLTGDSVIQEQTFHTKVPPGAKLRVFGAALISSGPKTSAATPPEQMVPTPASNYRRWWNNPWKFVEAEGQPKAGEWTRADRERLNAMVRHAHKLGYWIRFYTLNGYPTAQAREAAGTGASYDFGSLAAAQIRWRAVIDAGVDFVATDQYEEFSKFLRTKGR